MRQLEFTVLAQQRLTREVYRLSLQGDASDITAPGQFVDLAIPGFFLRRPISVCDWDSRGLTLIYKRAGLGTAALSALQPGEKVDLLSGLGNGFSLAEAGSRPLLVGGGVGTPPLYGLARRLLQSQGCRPVVLLGFNQADQVFYAEEFAALGLEVTVSTLDGSAGRPGLVTDILPELEYSYIYACGPRPMLAALQRQADPGCGGQFSLEERMGCGFGACMGCTCQTREGAKRLCVDGPVLRREEILWQS